MIATMAAVVSCTTDVTEDFGVEVGGKTQLTLSLDNTRTHLGEKNGDTYPLTWSENDQISVNGVSSYELDKIDIDEDGTSATFSFVQSIKAPYFIAYPAAEADNQVVFPTVQNYNAEAAINNGVTVMYGYSADGKGIKLSHLSGLLKIGVTGTTSLKEVRISSVDRKPIAGTFNAEYNVEKETLALTPSETASSVITYSFGAGVALSATATNFYVAVPAGAYEELYITLENTAGNTMFKRIKAVKTENNDKTLKAGSVREYPVVEFTAIDANETFIISDYKSWTTFTKAAANATEAAPVTKNAVFVADVEIPATGWTSVDAQYYTGTINGNGYAIKGLNAPLFNTLGATVKGLHLEDVEMTATLSGPAIYAGVLANQMTAEAVVENCSTSGTMTININKPDKVACAAGGIIGTNSAALTLSNLENNVDITVVATDTNGQTLNLGGIIGYVNAAVTVSDTLTNNGAMDITGSYGKNLHIGGVTGYVTSAITANGCVLNNNGTINMGNAEGEQTKLTKDIVLGGIVGFLSGANLTTDKETTITNNGTININNVKSSKITLGGLYGINRGTFYNSLNTGHINIYKQVTGSWFNIGGVAGYNAGSTATYTNAKNKGNITILECTANTGKVAFDVGGLFGTWQKAATLNGELINEGNITIKNTTNDTSTGWIGFGGILGGDANYATNINGDIKNSGDIKVIGGSYNEGTSNFGVGGVFGYMQNQQPKNATNTGDVTCATIAVPCKVGGLVGESTKGIKDSKCFAKVASFTWNGKEDGTLTKNTNVGIITGGAYDATKISGCAVGGWLGTSAVVTKNDNGELDVEVTYDTTLNGNNFFQYLCGSSNPSEAPAETVCKYWDGK